MEYTVTDDNKNVLAALCPRDRQQDATAKLGPLAPPLFHHIAEGLLYIPRTKAVVYEAWVTERSVYGVKSQYLASLIIPKQYNKFYSNVTSKIIE